MSDKTTIDPITAIGLLFETTFSLAGILTPQLHAAGLQQSEFEVLIRLSRSPDQRLRMSDLAKQVPVSNSGLTRLVDRLCAREVIKRETCETDGRVLYAQLTTNGSQLMAAILPGHREQIRKWLIDPLTTEEVDSLLHILRKLRNDLHPTAEAGANTAAT